MHIDRPARILSCDHGAHTDEELTECLAKQWGVTVPQLVAMLAAIVLGHVERAATRDAGLDPVMSLLPDLPARACEYCHRPLPGGTHPARRYCPGNDCRRLARNAWERAGRPPRKKRPRWMQTS